MRSLHVFARISLASSASALAMLVATPALAQNDQETEVGIEEIVVTAQRQAESLQDVPIAVSAFSAEALEEQQIENSSDLQLTLPNVTFTKGNFTASSFTIRGIGDLCVGVACDSATAIHVNGSPLLGTRLFETEFFDLERIEVLRGPQGTLFGRNATSGVVNFVTAKPDLTAFHASGEAEYGNFNSIKVKGMVNVPISETLGIRLGGFYLNRDGYTKNLFDDSRIDGRDMYAIRGSVRWEPTDTTRVDFFGYYFRENDDRMRIQKQLCHRDPTGVLGCLPDSRRFEAANYNSTFIGTLASTEFLASQGIPAALGLGLGSLYGPDAYAGFVNPANVRQVNTDSPTKYFTDEQQYQLRLEQDLSDQFKLQLTGLYHKARVDSSQDYNLSVQNRAIYTPALTSLSLGAAGAFDAFVPGLSTYLAPFAAAIIPNGPGGELCTSDTEPTQTGIYGGHSVCGSTPLDFDRSNQSNKDWSVEAILTSSFDGPFNFLLGGIYADAKLSENSYYVNAFGIDYISGLLGSFTSYGAGLPPSYLGPPFYRNNTDSLQVKSWGIFGEAYYEFNDRLKLTLGLRYNDDKKSLSARTALANFLIPYGTSNAFDSPFVGSFDADPGRPGNQLFQNRTVSFSEWTGRAVLDYQISDDSLLYASYSRGYKSGGINPPLSPVFAVAEGFEPEFVDAFEIGSKNTFLDGTLRLNLTGFYYKYKGLQLSRIVARTSVNDNVDANIYGLEAEAIIAPTPNWLFNTNFSYLKTKVSSDKFLANPRDVSGGRDDAVIIKDISNGSNCAVASTSGSVAGVNGFVNQVNDLINAGAIPGLTAGAGLQHTTPFPTDSGLTANGAFSFCGALAALAPTVGAAFGGVQVLNEGVTTNIKGNKLPQAPNFKFSVGTQYTAELSNGMTLVPRIDFTYTGDSYGNIFNGPVNRIKGYSQANAQIQLNGVDDKWFVRAFVQNIFDNNSVTGLYVTDASSGLFTNIFTLDPRRYGVAAGFKF